MTDAVFTKGPGWDWVVDYECGDGEVDSMTVFGQRRVEDAVLEARRSLSFNFFRLDGFSPPAIIGVRRA